MNEAHLQYLASPVWGDRLRADELPERLERLGFTAVDLELSDYEWRVAAHKPA